MDADHSKNKKASTPQQPDESSKPSKKGQTRAFVKLPDSLSQSDREQIKQEEKPSEKPSPPTKKRMAFEKTSTIYRKKVDLWKYRPKRRKKLLLFSLLSFIITTVALVAYIFGSEEKVFQTNHLSYSHAELEDRCSACHVPFKKVNQMACLNCHAVGLHHKSTGESAGVLAENDTASCIQCHKEHRGRQFDLLNVENRFCTGCHEHEEHDFLNQHPEFSIVKNPNRSTGLRFSHQVHMDAKLPDGPLFCNSCHSLNEAGLMEVPRFELHCQGCHQLEIPHRDLHRFEAAQKQLEKLKPIQVLGKGNLNKISRGTKLQDQEVQAVQDFLEELLQAEDLHLDPELEGDERKAQEKARRSFLFNLHDKELKSLEEKVDACLYCHDIQAGSARVSLAHQGLLPKAHFSHLPHRWVEGSCQACHEDVIDAQDLSHAHIPGLESCQSCHNEDQASTRCISCHTYHDHPRTMRTPFEWRPQTIPKPQEESQE